ncbi:protein N-terminal glutamine amidohydrolase isoform X2 [Antennarius striatus]|uniref:protein N-terminal glutamine amidohydrolase isoform X2 n=1 Tax=Antennarius striatus TaxID=241820 RepID=UPI0035B29885
MSLHGIIPNRDSCVYTSCYCEENVWKICEFVQLEGNESLKELLVVFISNENRTVPLWKQKSGHGDQPVIWVGSHSDPLVFDLDSQLSFPCSLQVYAAGALGSDRSINPAYHRKLRVIAADSFLSHFASDRSHMKNPDGSWKMPPPPYPPIHTTDCRMNLDDFISMDPAVGWGRVFSLDQFLQRYLSNSSSSASAASSSSSSSSSSTTSSAS